MSFAEKLRKILVGDRIEDKIEKLSEEWGTVYIVHRNSSVVDKKWIVRNHTDEGLGAEERLRFKSKELEECLDKAISEVFEDNKEE